MSLLGTICRNSKHGHTAWIIAEWPYNTSDPCNICGNLKTDFGLINRCCSGICHKNEDNKRYYWKLYSIGRKKREKILTETEVNELQGFRNINGETFGIEFYTNDKQKTP